VKRLRAAILLLVGGVAAAQIPNPGGELNHLLEQKTGGRFRLIFEFRVRDESRTGNNFGLAKNLDNPLLRTRIGAQFDATDWFRISATGQDARAPDYGGVAPTTARDSMDLHEAFLEFFAKRKTGFGAIFGRQVISLGEGRGRLIGDSQWTNTSRSYDTARLYYRLPSARIEVLMVSVVKILADKFNVPDLGDRVWGTYDTFTKIIPKGTVDFYLLRHDQNRPGGFTGIGRLGSNTLGGRAETDANEIPVRNDTPKTATCLAGPGATCAAAYSGTDVTFKTQTGAIGSRGDRDFYLVRATSAPAVIEAKARIPATAMDLALDILEAHPASPCQTDADCSVLKLACSSDDDCELSHQCVDATAGACTTSACRQCLAAGLCLPLPDSPGQSACGVTLFSVHDADGGMKTGADIETGWLGNCGMV